MSLARQGSAWLCWLWLLVATIAFHAVVPTGSPLVRTSGSAFSATTADVSLAPKRKDGSAQQNVELPDDGSGEPWTSDPEPKLLAQPLVVYRLSPAPPSRAPPISPLNLVFSPPSSGLGARAPPTI